MAYTKKTKKKKIHVDSAIVHIKSTFNNTLVSITTDNGDVLLRNSAGRLGFKGARKGTPFAASQIGAALGREMITLGIKEAEANMDGPGSGREAVVRAIEAAGITIKIVRDVTPIAHNGARAPKKRRV